MLALLSSALLLFLLLIAVAVFFILFKFVIEPKIRFPDVDKIPGPPSHWFFGHSLDLRDPNTNLQTTLKWAETYGKIFRIWIGPTPYVHLTTPETIKPFLRSSVNIAKGDQYSFISPYLGNGLVMDKGESWKIKRKALTGAFHSKILQRYVEVFIHHTHTFLKILEMASKKKEPFECLDPFSELALDIIGQCAFNYKMDAQQHNLTQSPPPPDAFPALNLFAMEVPFKRILQPLFWNDKIFYSTELGKRYRKTVDTLHDMTEKVIIKRLEEHKARKGEGPKDEADYIDFLDMLLDCQYGDDAKKTISIQDVRDEVTTFMFAGHDTTSHALAYTMAHLARYPQVQNRVVEEIKSTLGEKTIPDFKDLDSFPYTYAVIKESLRLYPPIPIISRHLDQDVEIEGYTLKKGVNVTVRPWVVHHNPAVWSFPDEFRPERFLGDNPENADEPFAFIPFSAGPRNCIGQKFALYEMKTVLSMILPRFEFGVNQDFDDSAPDPRIPPIDVVPNITLHPIQGIHLFVRERRTA